MATQTRPDESRFRAVFERLPEAIIVADADGRFIDANIAATRLLGYARDEIARLRVADVLMDAPSRAEAWFRRFVKAREWRGELRVRRKDGTDLEVEVSAVAVSEASGSVYVAVLRGVGPHPLSERRAALAAVAESSDDAIIGTTLDGMITSWNSGAEQLYGYAAADVVGRSIALIVPPERATELTDILGRLRQGQRMIQFETERLARDGRPIGISLSISPTRDADGRIAGTSAIARDVTSRRRAEQALRLSLSQLEAILRSAADGITVQNARGRLMYANKAAAQLCGFPSAADLLAATPAEVLARFQILDEDGAPLPPNDLPGRIALRERRPAEAVLRYHVPSTSADHWSLVRSVPVDDPSGPDPMILNVFQDITALKQDENRAQLLAQASGLLASSLDFETTLTQIAGLAVPALADWAAVDLLDPDGGIRRLSVAHADPAKLAWGRELERRYPINANDSAGVAQVIRTGEPEFYHTIPQELLEVAATDDELAQIIGELHLTSSIVVPLQARGRILGALSFVYAESERHYNETDLRFAQDLAGRAALALDNARLYSDALAALHVRDEFLASVSHDLRTPLTTVRGSTQLLVRQLSRLEGAWAERTLHTLINIDLAAKRMETMIAGLLDLARLESGRPLDLDLQQIDLVALVRELVAEHQRGAPGHRIQLDAPLSEIRGVWDPVRLERVIDNLLSNAIKYSPNGGAVVVTLGLERNPQTDADFAAISVADEGIGIPAADLARIFERFHRGSNVPPRTPGVGLGLAGARRIVELHGGTLMVESQEGAGSRFTIRLPVEASPPTEC